MKLLMDADCLIKLTKARVKEPICTAFRITVPDRVKQESVDQAPGLPDAECISNNITSKRIAVLSSGRTYPNDDDALVGEFNPRVFDAVGTDDRRLIRRLRALSIPFATPAICLLLLSRKLRYESAHALLCLQQLQPFISEDEFVTVRILMEKEKKS